MAEPPKYVCGVVYVSMTKDSPPSLTGAQERLRSINRCMCGVNGPVEKEGVLSCLLPLNEIQSFLRRTTHHVPLPGD